MLVCCINNDVAMLMVYNSLYRVDVTRFCNPLEASSHAEPLRDFEFACQELEAVQNARSVQLGCSLINC